MWRRQAVLALNGTAGVQASEKGASSYTAQLPTPTGRSVQQGDGEAVVPGIDIHFEQSEAATDRAVVSKIDRADMRPAALNKGADCGRERSNRPSQRLMERICRCLAAAP